MVDRTAPHRPRSAWDRAFLGLYLAYIALGFGMRWNGWLHFDHIWFVDAARHILDGSWRLYALKATPDIAPPDGLAYSYSPLPALLMTPFVALADALRNTTLARSVGGADQLAYRLIVIPLLIADVLAMEQFRRLAREWRPPVDDAILFLGIVPTLLLTGFLQVSAFRDHQEGLILLLLLVTLRVTPRHPAWGGMWAGLTLAAKQTAILELLPIGAVLLLAGLAGRAERRPRDAGVWAGLSVVVFGAFMLPPLLADPGNVLYAFVTQEQRRVILGQGLPVWIDAALAGLGGTQPALYQQGHTWLIQYSNAALVLVDVAILGGVLAWAARRGRPVGLVDSRLLALVALGGLLQLVLAKWVTGHYYQLPLALVLVWDTVRRAPRWPVTGLVGTLGFRAITVGIFLPALPWVKDGALFALFLGLSLAAIVAAGGREAEAPPVPGGSLPERMGRSRVVRNQV